MKLMNLKGTDDFLPKDQVIRNKIISILRNNFEKYGYMPLETPILNYYDLLSYKYESDAEILSEIYKLKDQGGRDLGLRYDLTVPFCKVIGLNKDLRIPFRRYEIGKVFRNGPVKLGRTREFYQCDVDVVGIDNRLIEAEQILMAINTYKDLGIDIVVKYNNRKLMSGLIKEVGIEDNLTSFYAFHMPRYTDDYRLSFYYYNPNNHSLYLGDEPRAVEVTIRASLVLFNNYRRTMFYEIRSN